MGTRSLIITVVGIIVGPNGVGLGVGIVGVMTFGAIVGSSPSLPNGQNSSLAGSNFSDKNNSRKVL